tara:strand:+ start:2012 stop:3835 length:1824 start_codon:yes stop_codon:yes gene_type:complete
MSDGETTSLDQRAEDLKLAAQSSHEGIYLTGPDQIELLSDDLPPSSFEGEGFLLASFGNCRCASDAKAIRQFDAHARVPSGAEKIALGHETLQLVLDAPADSSFKCGDVVVITPGHASEPIDPLSFEPQKDGVLAALGYSYRYLGGLRRFNAIPANAPAFVSGQGFGNLFNKVSPKADTSLISLAHAEPFACNYGTNKHVFTIAEDGGFNYGVPPRAVLAYLSGTARMAMINLTIVASVPDDELPQVVYVTGSQAKLDQMDEYALVRDLRKRGTKVVLIDRKDPAILEKLTEHGKSDVVWTNYASAETYDQAAAILADGGNLNNYAGAVDPDLLIRIPIGKAPEFSSLEDEVRSQFDQMHHNVGPNDPQRFRGLAREPKVGLIGFESGSDREKAYLARVPEGASVLLSSGSELPGELKTLGEEELITDLFIAGSGEDAAQSYAQMEPKLARSAAVNFVDGELVAPVRSRHSHYVSRHQLCGSNVAWHMTNTSEPHSDDMVEQASNPVSFDWMVKGVCGLRAVPKMMDEVERDQPFGSFFAFAELADLPYVETSSSSFRLAAESSSGNVRQALLDAADALSANDETWSRKVEEALYSGYAIPYPLNLA